MKKILLFTMCSMMLFIIIGCSFSERSAFDANSADNSTYTPSGFITLLQEQFNCSTQDDFVKNHSDIFWGFNSLSYSDAKIDAFVDITSDEVRSEVGCQIFKNKTFPISFILYRNVAYPIAAPMYGSGIINIETCDFDDNCTAPEKMDTHQIKI